MKAARSPSGGVLAIRARPRLGETVGPGGRSATPSSELKLSDAEVAKLKGGKYTAALALAYVVRFRERCHRGREGRIRPPRHSCRRPNRRRLRRRQAEERRRDHSRQEAQRDSRAAARSRHLSGGVQARRRFRRQDRPAVEQAEGLRPGQGLCNDRHRRSLPDGQARRRRARRRIGKKGKVAWIYHDAALLRDQSARQSVQDDDRKGLSRHQDRRRAGHHRSGARARHRAGAAASRIPISTASM